MSTIFLILTFKRLKWSRILHSDEVLCGLLHSLHAAVFELVALADRGLFCSSNDLLDSLNNPTVFCKITGECELWLVWFKPFLMSMICGIYIIAQTWCMQHACICNTHGNMHTNPCTHAHITILIGVVVHYVIVSASLWWLFHVATIFYAIVFPFHSRRTLSKYKYIYLIPSLVGR